MIEGERVKSDSQSVSQSCPTMGKMHCIAWHGDGMEWNGMERSSDNSQDRQTYGYLGKERSERIDRWSNHGLLEGV